MGGSSIHPDGRANSGSHSLRGWDQPGHDTAVGPSRALFVSVLSADAYGSAGSNVLFSSYCKFEIKGNAIPGQVESKGNAISGQVESKGNAISGQVESKGNAIPGQVESKGNAVSGQVEI